MGSNDVVSGNKIANDAGGSNGRVGCWHMRHESCAHNLRCFNPFFRFQASDETTDGTDFGKCCKNINASLVLQLLQGGFRVILKDVPQVKVCIRY